MEKDDMSFLDDLFREEKESKFDYLELFEYVVNNKKFKMELTEFLIVESGFREIWNSNTDKLIGDGQFKNYVYRYIEKQIENKKIFEPIPQQDVDECIDLILEYMSLVGEYKSDFSES